VGYFEIAPKTQYVHAHMTIKIQHRGKILLSYERMRAALNEAMGFDGDKKSIHFDPHTFHDTAATITDYVTKYGRGRPTGEVFDPSEYYHQYGYSSH